jgi:hypothetical protein
MYPNATGVSRRSRDIADPVSESIDRSAKLTAVTRNNTASVRYRVRILI